MDKFRDEGILENELLRIQKDIDETLYGAKQDEPIVTELSAEPIEEEAIPLEVLDAPIPSEPFYHETIKSEVKNENSAKRRKLSLTVAVLVLFCTFSGAIGLAVGVFVIPQPRQASIEMASFEPVPRVVEQAQPQIEEFEEPLTFVTIGEKQYTSILVNVVRAVDPAVVAITTIGNQPAMGGFFDGAPAYSGSGIIFHEDDERIYIATNFHVIGNANSVLVSVEGNDTVPARLVGYAHDSDLAVISVSKADLAEVGVHSFVTAVFGDSDMMYVGDMVLAIGNALGEGNTATIGIVGVREKEIQVHHMTLTVIQTDAAINPGNSGGPLVNLDGHVIGINTAKLLQANVEGMGYSITSNIAKPILDEIMLRTTRPFLGISGEDISPEMARSFNLPSIGVLVREVYEGTAAYTAGLRRTDLITSFRGEPVFDMQQLSQMIQSSRVGEEVEIRVIRNGGLLILNVTLTRYIDVEF